MSRIEVPDILVPKNGGNFPVIVPFTQANVAAAASNVNIDVGQSILMLDTLLEWITVPPASFAISSTCVNAVNSQLVLKGTIGGGSGVVVTGLAALKALSGVVGQTLHETSRGFSWKAFPYGDATADDVTVVNATDGSVTWQLLAETVDVAKWRAFTDWYIDGTSGSDWNTGANGSPLKTTDEIQRRCGADWDLGATDRIVHLLRAPANGRLQFDYTSNNEQSALIIKDESTRTAAATGTLTTCIAPSTDSKEATIIAVSGVSDWSSMVGYRVNFGTQGYARVLAANPEGIGAQYARISVPISMAAARTAFIPNYTTPTVGQSVTVETLGVTVTHLSITHRGSFTGTTTGMRGSPALLVQGIQTTSAVVNGTRGYNLLYRFTDCDITDMSCAPCGAVQWGGTARSNQFFTNQLLYGTALLPTALSTSVFLRDIPGLQHSDVIAQGCSVHVYENNFVIFNLSIFDSPNDGLYIHNLASVYLNGYLIGKGNPQYGLRMDTSSALIASGATLAITGAQGEVRTPSGSITCAQALPRKWDRGGGVFTIVSGNSVNVPAPALPSDAIVHAWSNNSTGRINVDTQTTSGFRVFSTESPEDPCSGYYEWFSPSTRPGGIVA